MDAEPLPRPFLWPPWPGHWKVWEVSSDRLGRKSRRLCHDTNSIKQLCNAMRTHTHIICIYIYNRIKCQEKMLRIMATGMLPTSSHLEDLEARSLVMLGDASKLEAFRTVVFGVFFLCVWTRYALDTFGSHVVEEHSCSVSSSREVLRSQRP